MAKWYHFPTTSRLSDGEYEANIQGINIVFGAVLGFVLADASGLPPGDFPLNIFGMVLNGITIRGSIVGTRLDLQESLEFAGDGKVKATISTAGLEDINSVFDRMRQGQIEGRVVLDLTV